MVAMLRRALHEYIIILLFRLIRETWMTITVAGCCSLINSIVTAASKIQLHKNSTNLCVVKGQMNNVNTCNQKKLMHKVSLDISFIPMYLRQNSSVYHSGIHSFIM